ncbi:MAG: hypothetical protein RLO80_12765 [Hyphomonas sp.]
MSKKRIVVVLGMHRSGTSAIARGLKALSVDLGANLMPPAVNDNDKGFWEDMDVYRLNQRLLSKVGNAWDRMSPVETRSLSEHAFFAERREASALIELRLSSSPIFGFKDPRTSILLPFWKCVFEDLEIEDNYIVSLRNPLEVAESLSKRDKIDTTHGLMLWLKYNWAAIENSSDKNRVCVAFEQLVDDPATQLARIATALSLTFPSPSSPQLLEYAGDFISRDLRHNRISSNELKRSEIVPAAVAELYAVLQNWANSNTELEFPAKLKSRIEQYLLASQPLLQLGDQLKARVAGCERARIELAESTEQLNAKIVESEQRVSSLEAAEEALREQAAEMHRQIKATETKLAEQTQQLLSADEHMQRLRGDLADKVKALQQVRGELLIVSSKLETLQTQSRQQLEDSAAQHERQSRALAEMQAGIVERDAALERLAQQGAKREQELDHAINQHQTALKMTTSDLERTKAALRNAEEVLQSKQEAVSDAQKRASAAVESHSALRTEFAERTKELRLLRHEVHSFRSSTSWKITKPLRMLRALLTYPKLVLIRLLRKGIS